jgi:peptidoglycan/xylan/chitin deacetylase (PgdA/CDA1 family)
VKDLLVRLGLPALARPLLGGRGTVLVFHRLGPRDASWRFEANHRNMIPVALFEKVLDTLAADGIELVTLDAALARLAAPRAGRFACLTFDDGYRDNHDLLLPVLQARRVPATIYIAPGLVDGTAPLWWYALDQVIARETRVSLPLPEETVLPAGDAAAKEAAFATAARVMLSGAPQARAALLDALVRRHGADPAALAARHMMDWPMIRRLAASPFVEIGAHTLTHPPLATLDAEGAAAEMSGSRDRLEHETGRQVRHLAFPYGVPGTTGPREVAMARDLGFRTAVTTLPGNLAARHAGTPQAWPRHGVAPFDGPAALRLKLAGVANPLRAARADK